MFWSFMLGTCIFDRLTENMPDPYQEETGGWIRLEMLATETLDQKFVDQFLAL